jgi:hypothetical protein
MVGRGTCPCSNHRGTTAVVSCCCCCTYCDAMPVTTPAADECVRRGAQTCVLARARVPVAQADEYQKVARKFVISQSDAYYLPAPCCRWKWDEQSPFASSGGRQRWKSC